MLNRLLKKVKKDFIVIDSQFPQKDPFAFRNSEINEYFKVFRRFGTYTMFPMMPDAESWFQHGYGISKSTFTENKRGYLEYYPRNANRIHYLDANKKYEVKLAYSYFLAETYVLLPFYEAKKIPFVFVLYPGGCFGLNFDKSDEMIKKICSSEYFRGVIATQQITKDYLLEKKLCAPAKVEYIYGGFVQFKKKDLKQKSYYGKEKKTFDICFVAAKYSEKGKDKGYDLFVEAAKKIALVCEDARFHVVGGFDEKDVDVTVLGDKITFYGYRKPDCLAEFYAGMDIFLSPNRPYALFDGNFDGFPLGIDSSYCGVALFVADELNMNRHYVEDKDIVVIPLDVSRIVRQVIRYYDNPAELYELARQGQLRTQELFDIDHQIKERLRFFRKSAGLRG